MTAQRIIHHIFSQPDIRHVDQSALEQLVAAHPYFAAARLLLAQKQYAAVQDMKAPAMKRAQLYSSSPQQLYQFLTAPLAAKSVSPVQETLPANPVSPITTTQSEPIIAAPVEDIKPVIKEETIVEAWQQQELTAPTEALDEVTIVDEWQQEVPAQPDEISQKVVEEWHDEIIVEGKNEIVAIDYEPIREMEAVEKADEIIGEGKDEIVAMDYGPIKEMEAVEKADEIIGEGKDEIVAMDYEPIKEMEAVEKADEIIGEGKDEIVAMDYEPIKEMEAVEKADEIIGEGKDEIVAIDYEQINEQEAATYEPEIEEEEITQPAENVEEHLSAGITIPAPEETSAPAYEPEIEEEEITQPAEIADEHLSAGITIPAPEETSAPAYEPEIEEEEITQSAEIADEHLTAGLTIPAAPEENSHAAYEPEIEEKEISQPAEMADEHLAADITIPAPEETPAPAYEPEIEEEEITQPSEEANVPLATGLTIPPAAEEANLQDEGPIRIHPMDTPAEETILTFQPLYTEDYFAYKKLKEPHNADMMTDKAQAEMRSFTDWLRELKDNFVAGQPVRSRYQEQMHRLYEDEDPEVSEAVEKMAMDSITLTNDFVSETLAEIWVRQHQHAKAIAIYEKLSLLNPDKNAYFAQKIQELQLLTDNNK